MFMNGTVADASEKVEKLINELTGEGCSIDSVLEHIQRKHVKGESFKPHHSFSELDSVFETLEPIEREGLYDYLRSIL